MNMKWLILFMFPLGQFVLTVSEIEHMEGLSSYLILLQFYYTFLVIVVNYGVAFMQSRVKSILEHYYFYWRQAI